MHAKVVFDKFEIKVGDKQLVSQVRTTEEAQQIYDDSVASGNVAAIGRHMRNTEDYIKFFVGAMPPHVPIIIKSSFH